MMGDPCEVCQAAVFLALVLPVQYQIFFFDAEVTQENVIL